MIVKPNENELDFLANVTDDWVVLEHATQGRFNFNFSYVTRSVKTKSDRALYLICADECVISSLLDGPLCSKYDIRLCDGVTKAIRRTISFAVTTGSAHSANSKLLLAIDRRDAIEIVRAATDAIVELDNVHAKLRNSGILTNERVEIDDQHCQRFYRTKIFLLRRDDNIQPVKVVDSEVLGRVYNYGEWSDYESKKEAESTHGVKWETLKSNSSKLHHSIQVEEHPSSVQKYRWRRNLDYRKPSTSPKSPKSPKSRKQKSEKSE